MDIKESEKTIELFELKARLEDEKAITSFLRNLVIDYSKLERDMARLIKQKNFMIGVAAHDLRNPLVSIRGFSDLLGDKSIGELNETQKEFVSLISNTANDLLKLLEQLLDLSAISSGSVGLRYERHNFSKLVKERVRLQAINASKKDLKIEVNDMGKGFVIFFDKRKIIQVLDNLLSNALKYSYPRGTIEISIYSKDRNLFFELIDCGPGIPDGEEKNLFGEFKRLNVKPTGGEKSTGLGLAISKKIIDAHGGCIYGKNNDLKGGAVFGFSIPMED
jgi:signal transduction histidine kinase